MMGCRRRRPSNHYHAVLLTLCIILAQTFTCISSFIQTKRTASGVETKHCAADNYNDNIAALNHDHDNAHKSAKTTRHRMVPLSAPPLLLLQSSTPILSREDCALLVRYFEQMTYKGEMDKAEALLQDVRDTIDTVTNCPSHNGEAWMPRYVRYDATTFLDETNLMQNPMMFGKTLLPDGLHVDTNNGKLFRHITAILYLTDNHEAESSIIERGKINGIVGGGTTFPMAVPIDHQRTHDNELREAAKRLLNHGIHHTKGIVEKNDDSDGKSLENAALKIFFRELQFNSVEANCCLGIRVMPEAGKLVYFHNVGYDGLPDPASFHGGESTLIGSSSVAAKKTKSILVFFKEIPVQAFMNDGREGFAKQAAKARLWTKRMYYDTKTIQFTK